MVHKWHTTTTLTKCAVVWCCGCCFEYPQQWQQRILTKCVVEWCCGSQHPQHHNMLLYGVVGVTTHNTIQQHILLKCVVVGTRNNTHNTIQQHILTKCVVVGTRNNTHNTIQQHTLLKCVVVGTRNNTHNTIQQHILLKCVVVGTRSNTIQQHTLFMLLLCVTYDDVGARFEYPQFTPTSLCCVSPMMMWVLFRVLTVYTHITLTTHFVKMCCCGYSKQHPQHHTTTHFVKMCCCGYSKQHPQHHTTTHFVKMFCCGYSKLHPQHHTTTHFVNVVVVCHLWTIVVSRICLPVPV